MGCAMRSHEEEMGSLISSVCAALHDRRANRTLSSTKRHPQIPLLMLRRNDCVKGSDYQEHNTTVEKGSHFAT